MVAMGVLSEDERKVQEAYWKEHCQGDAASVEVMMLDSQAAQLDKEERPEILSMLPPISGKVVELGSGIGRFTGALADQAEHVTAVDFMENLAAKNRAANGKRPNVDIRCADVMSADVDFDNKSVDLVFTNWLLMYLNDTEVRELGQKMLQWLRPQGHLFFRESCFHQSGDHKRKTNPTHYRQPMAYTKAFQQLQLQEADGSWWVLELEQCRCVSTYVRLKKNQNQVCWLWRKVPAQMGEGDRPASLDDGQYTSTGILRYERIFGEGYVSTGGVETTRELVAKLELQPGQWVLDIGSGLGGGDIYMANNFNAHVVGIDLSVNMISLALERAIGSSCTVEYELADCTQKQYPPGTFDVLYSRDTILHIHDKPALFREMLKWLKPGGRLLITDYCCGEKGPEASPEFAAYVAKRGYDLHTVAGYGQLLSDAGFVDVVAEDRTDQFIGILQAELERTEASKETFISDFSQKDYDDIIDGWKAKLVRCGKGEQKWGLFMAKKAASA